MVARLLHVLHLGIPPSSLLAMTFTTAAVQEVRSRVRAAAGKQASERHHRGHQPRTVKFGFAGGGLRAGAVCDAQRWLRTPVHCDDVAMPSQVVVDVVFDVALQRTRPSE